MKWTSECSNQVVNNLKTQFDEVQVLRRDLGEHGAGVHGVHEVHEGFSGRVADANAVREGVDVR
jgi:hypothetical protein